MAQKENQNESEIKLGVIYFILFAVFVFLGIFVKRVLGYPEFMMMFHLPAAVFLVLSGKKITVRLKAQYQKQTESMVD